MSEAVPLQRVSFESVESVIREAPKLDVSWVESELRGSSLPDKRLNARFAQITKDLGMSPMSPIPEACGGWTPTKGAYRFFDNDRCKTELLVGPHIEQTVERMKAHKVVLAVQDTVFYGFTHPNTTGIGPIGKSDSDTGRGLVMHHTLAFTPAGEPLGTLTQSIWARDEIPDETPAEKTKRLSQTSVEEKESRKWIDAANQTGPLTPEGVTVVTVCDREGDFWEFVSGEVESNRPFVVRAKWNRRLVPEDSAGFDTIMEALQQATTAGTVTVEIRGNSQRPTRTATVGVKFVEVTIKPPGKQGAAKESAPIEPLTLRVVAATEIDPPKGADAISWVLLTNMRVKSLSDAVEKINYYRCRWGIEVHHKVMKSGCRVEETRLETGDRLARFLAISTMVAYRLMHITYMVRVNPAAPCTEILSKDEIEALFMRTNKVHLLPRGDETIAFTVRDAQREIAKLGGFLARKSDGEPGIITTYRGFQRLCEDVQMLRAFRARTRSSNAGDW